MGDDQAFPERCGGSLSPNHDWEGSQVVLRHSLLSGSRDAKGEVHTSKTLRIEYLSA